MSFKRAFALSRDEVRDATPPGTVKLVERDLVEKGVHRVPRPSSDPADPLNWGKWRKAGVVLTMSLYALIANFASGSISSVFPVYATPLAFNPPVPFTELSRLIAVNVLMQGASNIWWVPLSNAFGRRPIVLISLVIFVLSSMWAGLASSFGSLLAARVFMGIGEAAADTVAPDVIGEIYFVHQRGRAMAVYTAFLVVGPFLGGLCGAYIVAAGGLPWLHWTNVILAAVNFALCLFLQPETLYRRTHPLPPRSTEMAQMEDEKSDVGFVENVESGGVSNWRPYTFAQSLKIGIYRGDLIQKLLAPYMTLAFPGVWLVMLWYAGLVGGIVSISTVAPSMVAAPPYLWGQNAGLINVGGLIGAVLGFIYTFLTSDASSERKAKHSPNGLTESEDRLSTAFFPLAVATAGLIVFGLCGQYPSEHAWVGLQVGHGMLAFGLLQVPAVGFTYLIDSYNAVSGDCFVMVTVLRGIISFAWTFFVSEWVAKDGAAEAFGIIGMLMGIFSLLTIPVLLWGKRMRIATAYLLPDEDHADH
ncbi:MFS general substrate transporter [Aulographum hederae CBS 113979]|uniref:MFS general substrate transporter n=1 Tax=Aulographum hederae CBS 113979 TaxID=1176131 RepID=A0A6G1GVL4_9PEZI|nr:MFS general substrate transporter [Aulographum hederae CBS 113979]